MTIMIPKSCVVDLRGNSFYISPPSGFRKEDDDPFTMFKYDTVMILEIVDIVLAKEKPISCDEFIRRANRQQIGAPLHLDGLAKISLRSSQLPPEWSRFYFPFPRCRFIKLVRCRFIKLVHGFEDGHWALAYLYHDAAHWKIGCVGDEHQFGQLAKLLVVKPLTATP